MAHFARIVLGGALALSAVCASAMANDDGNPFYSSGDCGSSRACASESSYMPDQYIILDSIRIDHLIVVIDSGTQGASMVIPNGSSNVELRFADGSPTIVLGTATLSGPNSGNYLLSLSPSLNFSVATVGHGSKTECDPGGVFGAVKITIETETNQLTIQTQDGRKIVLRSEINVRETGERPALFGCPH